MASLRDERTQQSRRLLVGAAAELFAAKGFRRTSLVDIAERAGVSRGSIPWHFSNKAGLLEAVLDEQLRTVASGFGEGEDGRSGDPVDRAVDYIRLPATRVFTTLLAEAVEEGSPIRGHYARLHDAVRQGVRARIPSGALPEGVDPEAFAVLLVGLVVGVHVQWRVAPGAVDLDAVREAVRALMPSPLGRP